MSRSTFPQVLGNKIIFRYQDPLASHVSVAGTFNNWDKAALPMEHRGNGLFIAGIEIPFAGTYHYKFVLNRECWIKDPRNNLVGTNLEKYENSLFQVASDIPIDEDLNTWRRLLAHRLREGTAIESELFQRLDRRLIVETSAKNPQIRHFFEERIASGLAALQASPPYALLHLYNMGYILKTPWGNLGFDVVSGKSVWGLNFPLSPDTFHYLISQLDLAFYSHVHPDHFDPEVVDFLLAKGKQVFVPGWDERGFPPGCSRPGRNQSFVAPLKEAPLAGIAYEGWHVWRDHSDPPVALFELRFPDGVSVLHTGDHDYTRPLTARPDAPVDLLFTRFGGVHPKIDASTALGMALPRYRPKVIALGHLEELGHPPQGGRIPYSDAVRFKAGFTGAEIWIPFWGSCCRPFVG